MESKEREIDLVFKLIDRRLGLDLALGYMVYESGVPTRIEVHLMDGIQLPDIFYVINHEYIHFTLECIGETVASFMFDNIAESFLDHSGVVQIFPGEGY